MFFPAEAETRAQPLRNVLHSPVCFGSGARQEVEDVLLLGIDVVFNLDARGARGIDQPRGIVQQGFVAADLHIERRKPSKISIKRTRERIASREKLGAVSPFLVMGLGEADSLVVEPGASRELLTAYRAAGLAIIEG